MKIKGTYPKDGDTKIVRRFLLFPRTEMFDDGNQVTRWLEYAYMRYKYFSGWWWFYGFVD